MDNEPVSRDHFGDAEDLLTALGDVPAFVRNRHLSVVAANAGARALSPAFRPGMNLVTFLFLRNERTGCEIADELPGRVVGLLRDSLQQHDEDERFRSLVGELEARSGAFATLWADESVEIAHRGRLTTPGPGALRFQELRLVDDYDLTVVVLSPGA